MWPPSQKFCGELKEDHYLNLHINFQGFNTYDKRVIKDFVSKKLKISLHFSVLGSLVGGGGLKSDSNLAYVTSVILSFPTV